MTSRRRSGRARRPGSPCCGPRSAGPARSQDLQRDDAELVALVRRDLAALTGHRRATPVDALVTRWGGGLPQYAVGHVERVARIRAAVAAVPGLAVCGAAYDGVGIPACIASARTRPPTGCWPHRPSRATMGGMVDGKQARELNDVDPLHRLVGVPGRPTPLGDYEPRGPLAAEVEALFEQLAAKDVDGARHLRRQRAAGRRRPDDLVARRRPPRRCRRPTAGSGAPRSGATCEPVWSKMALHRPAEFNKSHIPAFLADETAARLRLRLPVRALLRVVPAARRRAARAAGRARQDGPRLPRRPGQHGRVVRARRLRVDAGLRGRRAAPHRRPDAPPARRPRPAGTSARRCRSTPAPGAASPSWSTRCPSSRRSRPRRTSARSS